eukprot:scaffold10223_cov96-Skeletonema_dohrnii-CCMP3373.AAC.10
MMEEAPTDNKRRRISAADGSHQGVSCLSDLPSGILAHAASFLAAPSKVLFAVALDENSDALPNERSAAIVGNQWDILDFGEIEEDLAVKLSDAHIEKVLLCIDAVNNVKRLKLANCIHIDGTGLEPLRGSLIIEQIDLSLAGDHQENFLGARPPVSCDRVLPILDSIIEREGCALMYLQFPFSFVWYCEERSRFSDFHAFMLRYNQMWGNREETSCLECNTRLPTDGHEDCYQCEGCGRIFCKECSDPGATDFERTCGGCHDTRCDDCRFERFQFGHNCAECMKTIGPLLADECKRLCQEVEQLKVEIKELRSKS